MQGRRWDEALLAISLCIHFPVGACLLLPLPVFPLSLPCTEAFSVLSSLRTLHPSSLFHSSAQDSFIPSAPSLTSDSCPFHSAILTTTTSTATPPIFYSPAALSLHLLPPSFCSHAPCILLFRHLMQLPLLPHIFPSLSLSLTFFHYRTCASLSLHLPPFSSSLSLTLRLRSILLCVASVLIPFSCVHPCKLSIFSVHLFLVLPHFLPLLPPAPPRAPLSFINFLFFLLFPGLSSSQNLRLLFLRRPPPLVLSTPFYLSPSFTLQRRQLFSCNFP